MNKNQISIDYFPDGDLLSVTFGKTGRKGHGFELNENIYVRVDLKTQEPLGLTFMSYSKLIKLQKISLFYWNDLSNQKQQILSSILESHPVNLFFNLKKEPNNILPMGSFPDTSLQKLVAA